MVDSELIFAIHNALERGQNIEVAMQSLMNAGYSPIDVQEAARQVRAMLFEAGKLQVPSPKVQPETVKPKKKKILILIVILTIIALAIVGFLIMKFI